MQSISIIRFMALIGISAACALFAKSSLAEELSPEMRPWVWQQSTCSACPLVIKADRPELQTAEVSAFLRELESQKPKLMSLYNVSGQEYNLLAQMSVGILGRESLFFTSRRYFLKEEFPAAISVLKVVVTVVKTYLSGTRRAFTRSSRGPTQIKIVPSKIKEAYGFDETQLYIPANAAVATMGFLIESLSEMKRRINDKQITFVHPDNYVDYLPYMYFGSTKTLVSGHPDPEHNVYVHAMKNYMTWVSLYELDATSTPNLLH